MKPIEINRKAVIIKGLHEGMICFVDGADWIRQVVDVTIEGEIAITLPWDHIRQDERTNAMYENLERYVLLRDLLKECKESIDLYCPDGREKSLAFTRLEEAFMWANAAIGRDN